MTAPDVLVTRLSDVQPRAVEWLWPGRLPAGKLVVVDGDPGDGKSTMLTDIAARLSTGSQLPDGHDPGAPGSVVLLSAEDAADDTIRPRLDAAGADPSRVVIFDGVTVYNDEGEPTSSRPPSLPGDLDRLEALVTAEAAVLVIVDVLNAFLSAKVDGHKDQDIRSALMPLARMAERTSCCIVCIRHLNKAGGSNPLYRGGGSIGIIGAARLGMIVGADPDDDTRRILAVSKSNLAATPSALAYRLIDSPEHHCARVQWEGATTHSAADLLTGRDEGHEDRHDAAAALSEVLSDGPVWAKVAFDAMAEAGFSKDQAKRAKSKLGVTTAKVGKPGDAEQGWQWELPRRARQGCEGGALSDPAPFAPFVPPSGSQPRLEVVPDA